MLLVFRQPFLYKFLGDIRQISFCHFKCTDIKNPDILIIECMDMWWFVFFWFEEHLDNDSVKAYYFWHSLYKKISYYLKNGGHPRPWRVPSNLSLHHSGASFADNDRLRSRRRAAACPSNSSSCDRRRGTSRSCWCRGASRCEHWGFRTRCQPCWWHRGSASAGCGR